MTSREGTPEPKQSEKTEQDKVKNNTSLSGDSTQTDVKNAEEDVIDMNTFEQLLDMDDEDDHEFSYSIVNNYFEQAETTFKDMDKALKEEDLAQLSRLGHFLKGSSAAIGLAKVKATCEKIQNVGNRLDEEGSNDIEDKDALKRIKLLLPQVKAEYSEAEEFLKTFYEVQDAR